MTAQYRRMGEMFANPASATDAEVLDAAYGLRYGDYREEDWARWGIDMARYWEGRRILVARLNALEAARTAPVDEDRVNAVFAAAYAEERRQDRTDREDY